MAGRFQKVGREPLPGSGGEVEVDVYEWCPANPKKHGKFTIRFICFEDKPGPRFFFVEPLLRLWLEDKPTRFLEKACAYGYKVLTLLDSNVVGDREIYKLSQALFRNRHEGHIQVQRLFNYAADFGDFGPEGAPQLLMPGLDADGTPTFAPKNTRYQRANKLLYEALTQNGMNSIPHSPMFRDVLDWCESKVLAERSRDSVGEQEASFYVPFYRLPGRSSLDLLFTDGLTRNARWDSAVAAENIRSALIYGPVSAQDAKLAIEDKSAFMRFARKLRKAVNDRNPCEFDQWLETVRSHSYLSLIGGTRLEGAKKEEAALQAKRIYCALLWTAYERMARCYAALMLQVFADFCLSDERGPTHEEKWLFRQLHFPQLYLAGLPFGFLGKPQIRWVFRGLKAYWRGLVLEPARYDVFTDLLSIYGTLVRFRRDADRKRKQMPAGKRAHPTDPNICSDQEASLDSDLMRAGEGEPTRELSSVNCPKCGTHLESVKMIDRSLSINPSLSKVCLYCPSCDEENDYVVDLNALAPR